MSPARDAADTSRPQQQEPKKHTCCMGATYFSRSRVDGTKLPVSPTPLSPLCPPHPPLGLEARA